MTEKSSASDVMDSIIKSIIYILDVNDTDRNKHAMIKWYQEHVVGEMIAKKPCHILVRQISNLMQNEIEKDLNNLSKNELNASLDKIKSNIEYFKKQRDASLIKLSKYANSILSDTGTILLFGHSKLVIKALDGLEAELKAKTTIYVCEARNMGHYNSLNELEYCDGAEYASSICDLGKFKKVILVPDILVASLMSRNLIDKVIFGANGMDISDGTFYHSAGHLAIADLAYLYDIPIYVILDSFKFGDLKDHFRKDLERYEERKHQWLSEEKRVLSKLSEVDFYNPRDDIIHGEINGRRIKRFTALITDYGIIQANRIPKELIETKRDDKADILT
jgi:translation initiation factor 2B subunit (eIF-2B alpha/beta/delta family)